MIDSITINGVMTMFGIALLLALFRLIKGPSLSDRVVALDFISTCVIGMIVVDAIASGESYFLSVAIVAALVGFVGSVAFAMYIQKGSDQ
ncbi:MAG: monovalent cation/H+ antiporter complex subunit F [Candidatus Hydrogenedentes bacterium]|nr:monovalent cation/H+ antiporter complex subunit F [Candidatus Hydrogenedentota bacterium]